MRVAQLNTSDAGGGAEKIALAMHRQYRKRNCQAWLLVGHRRSQDPNVLTFSADSYSYYARPSVRIGSFLSPFVGKVPGIGLLRSCFRWIAQPRSLLEIQRGHEDFDFPGTWHLLELTPERPDIVHCHNLHGGYFDLRALPWLTHQVPVILTLHDCWLLSGHCAHSFSCERWKTGCGECPDLTIYPAIRRDATAFNWRRKREIYARSRFYVATPSRWLMRRVEQSMIAPSIAGSRVIPNGTDLTVFKPGAREPAREILGIPQDRKTLLFVGNRTRTNIWRDFATLEKAISRVATRLADENLLLICLGEKGKMKTIGRADIWFAGYTRAAATVAKYYQAADVYVHPARADTFPSTVLEALACGIPVVASAIGGIPEQVKSLGTYHEDDATGLLVPPGNQKAMAEAILALLTNTRLRRRLGDNAARDARERFDLGRQVDDYLKWYSEIVDRRD